METSQQTLTDDEWSVPLGPLDRSIVLIIQFWNTEEIKEKEYFRRSRKFDLAVMTQYVRW